MSKLPIQNSTKTLSCQNPVGKSKDDCTGIMVWDEPSGQCTCGYGLSPQKFGSNTCCGCPPGYEVSITDDKHSFTCVRLPCGTTPNASKVGFCAGDNVCIHGICTKPCSKYQTFAKSKSNEWCVQCLDAKGTHDQTIDEPTDTLRFIDDENLLFATAPHSTAAPITAKTLLDKVLVSLHSCPTGLNIEGDQICYQNSLSVDVIDKNNVKHVAGKSILPSLAPGIPITFNMESIENKPSETYLGPTSDMLKGRSNLQVIFADDTNINFANPEMCGKVACVGGGKPSAPGFSSIQLTPWYRVPSSVGVPASQKYFSIWATQAQSKCGPGFMYKPIVTPDGQFKTTCARIAPPIPIVTYVTAVDSGTNWYTTIPGCGTEEKIAPVLYRNIRPKVSYENYSKMSDVAFCKDNYGPMLPSHYSLITASSFLSPWLEYDSNPTPTPLSQIPNILSDWAQQYVQPTESYQNDYCETTPTTFQKCKTLELGACKTPLS